MTFRNLHYGLAAIVLGAGLATAANASQTVTQTASAQVVIVTPASMTKQHDLVFGSIAKPTTGTGQTITMASSSSATTSTITGTGDSFVASSSGAGAAHFVLNGTSGDSFTISSASLPGLTDGTNNLTNVAAEPAVVTAGASGTGPYTLTASSADIYVGGHFDVTPTTVSSTYTGTLTLTLAYN
jgi:hypothetical protein